MPRQLVLLTGPIASGKTTLGWALADEARRRGQTAATIELDDLVETIAGTDWRTAGDWLIARQLAAGMAETLFLHDIELVIIVRPFFSEDEREALLREFAIRPPTLFVLLRVSLDESIRRAQADPDPGRVSTRNAEFTSRLYTRIDWDTIPEQDVEVDTDGLPISAVLEIVASQVFGVKIAHVGVVRYRLPFREPYVTAAGAATHREGFVVRVETDTGLVGLGEGSQLPHLASGGDALEAMIRGVATRLLGDGLDAFLKDDQDESLTSNPLSWAPLSIAAWDIAARMRGLPLAYHLNPGASYRVAVNALIGGGPPEAVRLAAVKARDAGYRTLKLKVGTASSQEEERERVAACRSELPSTTRLRLDANGAWSEEQAIETLRELIAYDLDYVEQPVTAGDVESLARVRDLVPVRVAADEDVTDRASAHRLLQADAVDVLVLKPLHAGGIGQLCLIAGEAAAKFVDVTITTSIDSGIGTAAGLHLAAVRGGRAHGLATLPLLEDDLILEPGLPIKDGYLYLPDAPGLGVELDEAALQHYTVSEWSIP